MLHNIWSTCTCTSTCVYNWMHHGHNAYLAYKAKKLRDDWIRKNFFVTRYIISALLLIHVANYAINTEHAEHVNILN